MVTQTSPNEGDRIGGAEPSAYLPGDMSGYSPRLSIVTRSSGFITTELGIVRPRTRIGAPSPAIVPTSDLPVTQTSRLPRAG